MNKTVKRNNIIRVFHRIKQMNKSKCIGYISACKNNTYEIFNRTDIPSTYVWVANTVRFRAILTNRTAAIEQPPHIRDRKNDVKKNVPYLPKLLQVSNVIRISLIIFVSVTVMNINTNICSLPDKFLIRNVDSHLASEITNY